MWYRSGNKKEKKGKVMELEFKKHNIISYSIGSILTLGMGPFLEKISFKVIISDDRISIIQGLLGKKVVDIPKSKIECRK